MFLLPLLLLLIVDGPGLSMAQIGSLANDLEIALNPADQDLRVSFGINAKADGGNEIELSKVQKKPEEVKWSGSERGALYTLAMVDPDAPSNKRPSQRYNDIPRYNKRIL